MKIDKWFEQLYQWSKNPTFIAGAVFLLLLIISFGTSSIGMSYDEGQWNYIGRAWLKQGVPPYAGAMENKNMAIYLIFGVSNLLFGVNFWFPRILGIISLTFSAVLVFKTAHYLHSNFAASLAMIFFGFGITWQSTGGKFTAQTESFMILFILLGLFLMLKMKDQPKKSYYLTGLFASGLLIGIAVHFKQIAILSAVVLYALYVNHTSKNHVANRQKLRDFAVISAGIICCAAIGLIPLLLSELALMDYLNGAWLVFLKKGSPTNFPISRRIEGFIEVFKRTELILFYPLIFAFIMQRSRILLKGIPFAGILLWMGMDFLAINLSGTYAAYQLKLLLPSFSIASAVGLSIFLERDFIGKKLKPAQYGQIILVILILWIPIYIEPIIALKDALTSSNNNNRANVLCQKPFNKPNDADRKQLGLWIKETTDEKDFVYVAGYGAPIQAYSERISPTKYFDAMFLNLTTASEELGKELLNHPPKLILVPRFREYKLWVAKRNRSLIENILQQYYHEKACYYGYNIYERN